MAEPVSVETKNGPRGIPLTPAGTEIRVRTPGTMRRTEPPTARSGPTNRRHDTTRPAPPAGPRGPATGTTHSEPGHWAGVERASVKITDDGIGGKTFAASISRKTPKPPSDARIDVMMSNTNQPRQKIQ